MSAANRDLVDYIDIHRVKALNITAESNPEFLFGKYLNVIESRADPQIILVISFLTSFFDSLLTDRFRSRSL